MSARARTAVLEADICQPSVCLIQESLHTSISCIARQTYEGPGTVDEYNSSVRWSCNGLDILIVLGPDFQHSLRGVGRSEVVVPHAAFEIVGRDVYEEPTLCLAPTSAAIQHIRQSDLTSESFINLHISVP